MAVESSPHREVVLEMLAQSRNVLISGPPGTGKSRLLAEVALAFERGIPARTDSSPPRHDLSALVPIPARVVVAGQAEGNVVPSPTKPSRRVFRTAFHQASKNRDFITGILPSVNVASAVATFRVVEGTLYRASEHAKRSDGAALLIIDEINRGPAVEIFGGSIVGIESSKRLLSDGTQGAETQFFEIIDPSTGNMVEYALPSDLYILAAMNQADASVEPLDVAFLRRWAPFRLAPNYAALRHYYGLPAGQESASPLPEEPSSIADLLEASVRALDSINRKISLGRGGEFQIGHGILMRDNTFPSNSMTESKKALCSGWERIRAHVDEVFFGDVRGSAAVLNALDGPDFNPFRLVEKTFADELRFMVDGPSAFTHENIYSALRAFAE